MCGAHREGVIMEKQSNVELVQNFSSPVTGGLLTLPKLALNFCGIVILVLLAAC